MNTTDNNNAPELRGYLTKEDHLVIEYVGGTFLSIISLFGVVSNAINVCLFVKIGLKDGVIVSFLGLSSSDLALSTRNLINGITRIMHAMEMENGPMFTVDPYAILILSANAAFTWGLTTVLITLFIAIVRCLCVVKPLMFMNSFTARQSGVYVLLVNALSLAIHIPMLCLIGLQDDTEFVARNRTKRVLWSHPLGDVVKKPVRMVTFTSLPLFTEVVLIGCALVMARALRRSVKFRMGASGSGSSSSPAARDAIQTEPSSITRVKSTGADVQLSGKELLVVQQVAVITLLFLLSNTFSILCGGLTSFVPGLGSGSFAYRYHRMYELLYSLRRLLEQSNSSVNIFIYLKYNSTFYKLWKRH